MKPDKPLVSILIPNRNHSIFLDDCIRSALNQTYDNIEIILLDNCSDDNSLEVAAKYASQGVRVCRNLHNIINKNYNLLADLVDGKYQMLLCADDMILPEFVETAVGIMEKNDNVGYVHCERDYIDAHGAVTELDPFYNSSFVAPGESALPIYMLTDVAQPAQCLMRRSVFDEVLGYNTEFDHTNADKELWFRFSMVSDYAYVKKKLTLIRIHEARETISGYRRFFHPLALYLTFTHQAQLGALTGNQAVVERLPVAMRKLAVEALQICRSCLDGGERELARQYLVFSRLACDDIAETDDFKELELLVRKPSTTDSSSNGDSISETVFIKKLRQYDPPAGYLPLEVA